MSSKNIEEFMDRADEWNINDFDLQGVVDQHSASAQDAEVIEVDAESTPDEARHNAAAMAKQQQSQAKRKKKKLMALAAVGVVVVGAVAMAQVLRPKRVPIEPVDVADHSSVVQSQFAHGDPAPDAARLPGALPAAQDPIMAGAQAAQPPAVPDPAAAARPVPGAEAAAAPLVQSQSQVPPTPTPSPSAPAADAQPSAADVDLKAKQEALARLERENKDLKEQLAKAVAQRPAASAPVNRYGADVYRIYVDGIVLLNGRGEHVPVAIGEVTRKYGRLMKTDPDARTFVTDRGVIRPGS